MAYLKTLLAARLVSLFFSAAFTLCVVGLSGKSLSNLHHDRQLASKLLKGAVIHANDVLAILGVACGAAGLGVIVSFFSEVVLFIEKRKGMPRHYRYINEFLMGFCTLLLLAVAIAATVIVVNREATVTAPGIPSSTIAMLLKATGKSLRYRDTFAYYAMICTWFAWFFVAVSFVLLVLAGLHYRKSENHRAEASSLATTEKRDEHDVTPPTV
ncbi:hypothetical protein CcaverHIS002_0410430 [Cutaneotrichosporon cavernicola]|uniref:Uncharacterized protein n=1 Tax=Cutaneotrichosporon cavernicola TaxID=279322 RepID=A0AA48L5B2_9TREE|nr:uncharacterized protein CcaverHIS019_0410330 [Cutaneotrichosporon cavernicola]BEI84439.1 hypothetical protein CcaverHIS002_0410430 [Cutaneotrichosporon cavernicola]BEI92213.1 hypothetical protein CcaverHIS019_0410330 [Cutaneotrichosporon cavernicola]BEI99984.1 hypothetical protein CcaverHIS631_0410270 [Cutaneotrichosporon cavernicola]BEJ07757.1 hypothetical protein CcaverHIS641_0410260 [Cutaneotrichosporon cavernicola]